MDQYRPARKSALDISVMGFTIARCRQQAEDNADTMRFQGDFVDTFAAFKIVETEMGCFALRFSLSNPGYIFHEFCRTNSREANPDKSLVDGQQTATPSQH